MSVLKEDAHEPIVDIYKMNKNAAFHQRLSELCDSIIVDSMGDPVKSDLDLKTAKNIARIVLPLRNLANSSVRAIDPENELFILRLKTKKNETFISYDEKFTLILMQNVQSKTLWIYPLRIIAALSFTISDTDHLSSNNMSALDKEDALEPIVDIVKRNEHALFHERLFELCDSIIIDSSGNPVKSDLDIKMAKNIARIILPLRNLANSTVRTIDPEDELFILRVKTKKNETFITYDEKFTLINVQHVKSKTSS